MYVICMAHLINNVRTMGLARKGGAPAAAAAAAAPGVMAMGPTPRGGGCRNPAAVVAVAAPPTEDAAGAGNLPVGGAGAALAAAVSDGDVLGRLEVLLIVEVEEAEDARVGRVGGGAKGLDQGAFPPPGVVEVGGVGLEATGKPRKGEPGRPLVGVRGLRPSGVAPVLLKIDRDCGI